MKKIFFLMTFTFMGTGSCMLAMQSDQNTVKTEIGEKTKTSKKDIAKLGAATLGCFVFGGICLTSYPALNQAFKMKENNNADPSWHNIPALLMSIIFFSQLKYLLNNSVDSETSAKIIFGLTGITSGILSGLLGRYAYKKWSQIRSNKIEQAKKIAIHS